MAPVRTGSDERRDTHSNKIWKAIIISAIISATVTAAATLIAAGCL